MPISFEFDDDGGGKARWQLKSSNGKFGASPGESFASRSNAKRAAAAYKANVAKNEFEVDAGSGGQHRWRAKSRNRQTVASSGESFDSASSARRPATNVQKNAGSATTVGALSVRFLIEAAESNGSVTVFECDVPAGSRMPAPHSHDAFEETIYGAQGVSTWTVDGEEIEVGPDATARRFTPEVIRNAGRVRGTSDTIPSRCGRRPNTDPPAPVEKWVLVD